MALEQFSKEERFSLDIRRTFLLGAYMNEWGCQSSGSFFRSQKETFM